MKSDIEIKDIIFGVIEHSALHDAVSGNLYRDQRPTASDKEDIVIRVIDGANATIQRVTLEVNIYVPDSARDADWIEDTSRLRLLSRLACELLEEYATGDFRLSIEKQLCLKVEGVDQHFINNKIILQITNF